MNDNALIIGIGANLILITFLFGFLCWPLIRTKDSPVKSIGMVIAACALFLGMVFIIVGASPNKSKPMGSITERAQVAQKLLVGQEVSLQDWVDSFPSGTFPAAIEMVTLELKLTTEQVQQLKNLDNFVVSMRLNPTNLATNAVK